MIALHNACFTFVLISYNHGITLVQSNYGRGWTTVYTYRDHVPRQPRCGMLCCWGSLSVCFVFLLTPHAQYITMAGYVGPHRPVMESEFSPLEDTADRTLTPCRHPPPAVTR